MTNCKSKKYALDVTVYETSAAGNALTKVDKFSSDNNLVKLTINPNEKFQTITGFGGAFTESSAYLLYRLSAENRKKLWKPTSVQMEQIIP